MDKQVIIFGFLDIEDFVLELERGLDESRVFPRVIQPRLLK